MLDLSKIKRGDVLLVYNPITLNPITWLSALIRLFTRSHWNHAGAFDYEDGVWWFYEATEKGFIRTIVEKKFEGRDMNHFKLKRKEDLSMIGLTNKFHSLLNTKYDFQSTLFYQLVKQISKKKKWYGKKAKALDRVYCSEAVAYILGYENYYEITPKDLDLTLKDVV